MERHRDLTNRAWGNHLLFFLASLMGKIILGQFHKILKLNFRYLQIPPKNDHGQLHRHAAFEPKVAHNSNIWNTGLILKHTPVLNFASKKIAWAKREHSAMPRYVLFSEQLLFLTVGPEGASIFKKPHNSWWTWVNMFHSYWGMGALKFYGYPLVTKHGDNSPFTDDFIMIVPLRPPMFTEDNQWISQPPAEESTDIHQGWGHFWGHFGYERLSIIQTYPPSFKVQF